MPDVPMRPRPEPEVTLAEKAEPVLTAARVLLTGSPFAPVRRPLLYALTGFGIIAILAVGGFVGLFFGGIAIIALLLLAWTDQLV